MASKKWIYDDSNKEKPFKCVECDFRSTIPGGINLHYAKVHGSQKQSKCMHENIRLLRRSVEIEKLALQKGFYAVCEDCEELLKESDL